MHPWGKWGRNFVEYGVDAARAALATPASTGATCSSSPAPTPCATATPATSPARRSPRRSAGPARGSLVLRRLRVRRTALDAARARILAGLCDVALVVGADTTPKGFLAPNAGERRDDPDWLRFRLLGATNPTYFALYARRRMDLYGATPARLRPGEGEERPPRPATTRTRATARRSRSRTCWPRRWSPTRCGCWRSARRPTAAPRSCSRASSTRRRTGSRSRCGSRDLDGDADVPEHGHRDAQLRDRLRRPRSRAGRHVQGLDRAGGVRGGRASAPTTSTSPRSTTCRPRSSSTGTRTSALCRPGEAEQLLRDGDTTIGGRIPVNPSRRPGVLRRGGAGAGARAGVRAHLAAARPGRAGARSRAPGSGITANQGLFGHGSSVILSR